ncbi:MAG: 5'-methylthioadenosine/S-adenosylhomocysteine nucleosidase [Acutalibacteraceae bacterium]|jgi:adenosylhomocysteine nucleosidase
MKHIGMLVAREIDAVLNEFGQPQEERAFGDFTVRTYQMPGYTLSVMHSGIGEIAAAAATQLLISVYGVDMIINFGVVGGLTPEMGQTRTCVVERVVHTDYDGSAIDGTAVGQYIEYPDVYIPTTPELVDKATALNPALKRVTCASADKFISGEAAKTALHEQFGADICEMEAAGVVLTCRRNRVPCLLIKTVSDSITGGAEEYYEALEETSRVCLRIADAIIREL